MTDLARAPACPWPGGVRPLTQAEAVTMVQDKLHKIDLGGAYSDLTDSALLGLFRAGLVCAAVDPNGVMCLQSTEAGMTDAGYILVGGRWVKLP